MQQQHILCSSGAIAVQKLKSGLKEIGQPEVMLSKAYHVVYTLHQDEHALSHSAAL